MHSSTITVLPPQAVLRIHFIEAQDLLSKDKILGGLIKGKSDPYGVVRVGADIYKSKVIQENLNPKWNEVYEVSGARRNRVLESRRNQDEFKTVLKKWSRTGT